MGTVRGVLKGRHCAHRREAGSTGEVEPGASCTGGEVNSSAVHLDYVTVPNEPYFTEGTAFQRARACCALLGSWSVVESCSGSGALPVARVRRANHS